MSLREGCSLEVLRSKRQTQNNVFAHRHPTTHSCVLCPSKYSCDAQRVKLGFLWLVWLASRPKSHLICLKDAVLAPLRCSFVNLMYIQISTYQSNDFNPSNRTFVIMVTEILGYDLGTMTVVDKEHLLGKKQSSHHDPLPMWTNGSITPSPYVPSYSLQVFVTSSPAQGSGQPLHPVIM